MAVLDPEPCGPILALPSPTMAIGKLAAPTGVVGLNVKDRHSPTEVCGDLESLSLADPTSDRHAGRKGGERKDGGGEGKGWGVFKLEVAADTSIR